MENAKMKAPRCKFPTGSRSTQSKLALAVLAASACLLSLTPVSPLPAQAQMPPGPEAVAAPPLVETAEGPLREKRQNLVQKIQSAKDQGIGIASYMAAFNFIEEMVKSKAAEADIGKRIDSLDNSLEDQFKRSAILKTQRPTPPIAESSPPPSAMMGGGGLPDLGGGGGDIISKLKSKYGGQIPPNLKDKLPPGLQEKLSGLGGDPSQLLNDPNLKDILKGLKK